MKGSWVEKLKEVRRGGEQRETMGIMPRKSWLGLRAMLEPLLTLPPTLAPHSLSTSSFPPPPPPSKITGCDTVFSSVRIRS